MSTETRMAIELRMLCIAHVLGRESGPRPTLRKTALFHRIVCAKLGLVALFPVLLTIFLFPTICAGQGTDVAPMSNKAERALWFTDVTVWSAQSVGSINVMSSISGQEVFAAGIGLRRHIYAFRHTVMRWNFEIMPVCLPSFPTANGRTYHYGGGGSLGADLELRKRWRTKPFFDANVGLVGFTDATPDGTRRKNYTLQFGPGINLPMKGRGSLRTGVRFFHFSNMRTEPRNPGFDAVVLYMGYSFDLHSRRQAN